MCTYAFVNFYVFQYAMPSPSTLPEINRHIIEAFTRAIGITSPCYISLSYELLVESNDTANLVDPCEIQTNAPRTKV